MRLKPLLRDMAGAVRDRDGSQSNIRAADLPLKIRGEAGRGAWKVLRPLLAEIAQAIRDRDGTDAPIRASGIPARIRGMERAQIVLRPVSAEIVSAARVRGRTVRSLGAGAVGTSASSERAGAEVQSVTRLRCAGRSGTVCGAVSRCAGAARARSELRPVPSRHRAVGRSCRAARLRPIQQILRSSDGAVGDARWAVRLRPVAVRVWTGTHAQARWGAAQPGAARARSRAAWDARVRTGLAEETGGQAAASAGDRAALTMGEAAMMAAGGRFDARAHVQARNPAAEEASATVQAAAQNAGTVRAQEVVEIGMRGRSGSIARIGVELEQEAHWIEPVQTGTDLYITSARGLTLAGGNLDFGGADDG